MDLISLSSRTGAGNLACSLGKIFLSLMNLVKLKFTELCNFFLFRVSIDATDVSSTEDAALVSGFHCASEFHGIPTLLSKQTLPLKC